MRWSIPPCPRSWPGCKTGSSLRTKPGRPGPPPGAGWRAGAGAERARPAAASRGEALGDAEEEMVADGRGDGLLAHPLVAGLGRVVKAQGSVGGIPAFERVQHRLPGRLGGRQVDPPVGHRAELGKAVDVLE